MTNPSDGRVFIAYDPQDGREARELSARLERAGFGVWLADRDAATGPEQGYAAVRSAAARSACLVLVLSGRPVNMAMLGDLAQLADSAGRPIFPVRVAAQARAPDFPALARAKAWIDASGAAAEQEYARLIAELGSIAQRLVAPAPQQTAQPQWPPPPAPAPPAAAAQSYQQPVPPPQYPHAPPGAAPAPAYGSADWNSTEVQPGETSLGSWMVAIQNHGPEVTGSLTVTDRRILFKPKVAGRSLLGMLLSQRKSFKDRHTVVLSRDRVVGVHSEKRMISTWIFVTAEGGAVYGFNRGVMSPDPILAALQPR